MTREEAKCVIKAMLDDAEKYGDIDYHNLSDFISACKVAIESLLDVPDTKVGKWIYSYSDMICPICNASFDDEIIYMCENGKMNFCPNCGAKMEE